MLESEKWKWCSSVMSHSSQPHGLQPTMLLCPWDFPGKSTGVGCHRLPWVHYIVSTVLLVTSSSFDTTNESCLFSSLSVQLSHSVWSHSLWLHGLQNARLLCLSPNPGTCSNSCTSSQWCHPMISSFVIPLSSGLQFFPASRSFPESVLHIRWPKYWSFSFTISPSNEYSGLISFRMNWFDLLTVRGTLKSLLQHHSSKASILLHSAFLWYNSHMHTWLLEKP